ncbi:MAG: prepilin-type N-terminal cleavage/methylation domain-containing protein [Spirochaetes bacterium]|nr:prepilin-type N-terminal cleavage/methylation domain-containing protein [Spirochaetota bacterium]
MQKGFTLIEVMIVVVIAVTVAAFAVPAYKRSMERNKFMAAEGKLIELSSALRNVQQMFGGYSCPNTTPEDMYLNQDEGVDAAHKTLNKAGCQKYPHECMRRNGYTKATVKDSMNSYGYSIEEDCSVCMERTKVGKLPVPYKVCIDNMGTETLKYFNNGTDKVVTR